MLPTIDGNIALSYGLSNKLAIKLNIDDPLRQFGLSDFNRALNCLYIFIALIMIIPCLSHYNQIGDEKDLGQYLLVFLLPLLLTAPLIIPITDRFMREPEAKARARTCDSLFHEQRLWPFDSGNSSYIGKIAAMVVIAEYAYIFHGVFPGFK